MVEDKVISTTDVVDVTKEEAWEALFGEEFAEKEKEWDRLKDSISESYRKLYEQWKPGGLATESAELPDSNKKNIGILMASIKDSLRRLGELTEELASAGKGKFAKEGVAGAFVSRKRVYNGLKNLYPAHEEQLIKEEVMPSEDESFESQCDNLITELFGPMGVLQVILDKVVEDYWQAVQTAREAGDALPAVPGIRSLITNETKTLVGILDVRSKSDIVAKKTVAEKLLKEIADKSKSLAAYYLNLANHEYHAKLVAASENAADNMSPVDFQKAIQERMEFELGRMELNNVSLDIPEQNPEYYEERVLAPIEERISNLQQKLKDLPDDEKEKRKKINKEIAALKKLRREAGRQLIRKKMQFIEQKIEQLRDDKESQRFSVAILRAKKKALQTILRGSGTKEIGLTVATEFADSTYRSKKTKNFVYALVVLRACYGITGLGLGLLDREYEGPPPDYSGAYNPDWDRVTETLELDTGNPTVPFEQREVPKTATPHSDRSYY